MNAMFEKNTVFPIKLTIRIIIEEDIDKEFIARSPEFNNVFAGGSTKEEALENFKVAFQSYIIFLIKNNKPISCVREDKKIKNQVIEDIEIMPNLKTFAFV